ncbi:MAG: hypothetical protein UW18_C0018G0012 [Microgenomates group bacterium GW2011_GWF1_44_10]|nr:MAG: hypothetical protein UW18_C0018G0012 [Microgenomates group bacterium GW2011_GWF1_44_10]
MRTKEMRAWEEVDRLLWYSASLKNRKLAKELASEISNLQTRIKKLEAKQDLAALRSRIAELEVENERLKNISRTANELAHVVIEDDIIVNNVDVCESCKYRARKLIEEYRKEQK